MIDQPKPVEGWLARTLERATEAANRAPEWATSRQPGESACSASPFASVPAGPFLGQTRLVEARREFNHTNCVRNAVLMTIDAALSPPARRTSYEWVDENGDRMRVRWSCEQRRWVAEMIPPGCRDYHVYGGSANYSLAATIATLAGLEKEGEP